MDFTQKYLKYKKKYIMLKNSVGGVMESELKNGQTLRFGETAQVDGFFYFIKENEKYAEIAKKENDASNKIKYKYMEIDAGTVFTVQKQDDKIRFIPSPPLTYYDITTFPINPQRINSLSWQYNLNKYHSANFLANCKIIDLNEGYIQLL